jgi:iron complex outermembrane receptor protein
LRPDLVVGGYYLKQEFDLVQTFPTLPHLFTPSLPFSSADYAGQESSSRALFGQAIWHATDRMNVTFGVRYTKEKKYMLRDPVGLLLPIITDGEGRPSIDDMADLARAHIATNQSIEGRLNSDRFTFKAGFDYQLTDDVMGYFLFSQGFRSGGLGARAGSRLSMGPTEDNTADSFEVGLKTEMFDNTLRLNIAAFYGTYKNLEFGKIIPNPDLASGQEAAQQNIGKARTKGIELEATWQPDRYWTFVGSAGYLDASFLEFCADLDGATAYATPPTSTCGAVNRVGTTNRYFVDEDFSDNKLSRAPKWKLYGRLERRQPLPNDNGELFIQGSVTHVTKYFTDSSVNHPDALVNGYTLVDAAFGWESNDNRFRLTLWGKNLTDKSYVTGLTPTPPYFNQRYYSVPRTYGLTLSIKG